jgi:hypothetical protein
MFSNHRGCDNLVMAAMGVTSKQERATFPG